MVAIQIEYNKNLVNNSYEDKKQNKLQKLWLEHEFNGVNFIVQHSHQTKVFYFIITILMP